MSPWRSSTASCPRPDSTPQGQCRLINLQPMQWLKCWLCHWWIGFILCVLLFQISHGHFVTHWIFTKCLHQISTKASHVMPPSHRLLKAEWCFPSSDWNTKFYGSNPSTVCHSLTVYLEATHFLLKLSSISSKLGKAASCFSVDMIKPWPKISWGGNYLILQVTVYH